VFYRLISGLHASTTAHICEHYHMPDGSWAPNLEMFSARLGAFPDRLKNIYFTFVYLLRAATKASGFLTDYDYYTGNPEDDAKVVKLVNELLTSKLLCSSATFDESTMFKGEKAALKRDFMQKFRNISEIMDCVSCQTCKVHAKLQVLGIATATKILMAEDPKIIKGLQRNEVIALLNTLQKFSDSIKILHNMKELEQAPPKPVPQTQTTYTYPIFAAVIVLSVTSFFKLYKGRKGEKVEKKEKKDRKEKKEKKAKIEDEPKKIK